MKFDLADKNDQRITESSPYALVCSSNVARVPDREGICLLINGENQVTCVGKTSGNTLKEAIKAQITADNGNEAKKYRWFVTRSSKAAKELEADWIRKYCY